MADSDLAVYKGQAIEQADSLVAIISSYEMQRHLAAFSVPDEEIKRFEDGLGSSRDADKIKYKQGTPLAKRAYKGVLRVFGAKQYRSPKTEGLELTVIAAKQLQKSVSACGIIPQAIDELQNEHATLYAKRAALEKELSGLRDFLSGGAVRALSLADRLRNYDRMKDEEKAEAASDAAARCGYGIDVSDASVREFYAQRLIGECLGEEQKVRMRFTIAIGNYHSVDRQMKSIEERGTKLMKNIIHGLEHLRVIREIYQTVKTGSILTIAELGMAELAVARAEIETRAKKLQETIEQKEAVADGMKQAEAIAECRVPENKVHLSVTDMCAEIDAVLGKKKAVYQQEEIVVIDAETGREEAVTKGR